MKLYYEADGQRFMVTDEYAKHDVAVQLFEICKENFYQDPIIEQRAMQELRPAAFMIHCWLATKPQNRVWALDVEQSFKHMSVEEVFDGIGELFGKGYIDIARKEFVDSNGEVVTHEIYKFYEQPVRRF